MLFKGKSICAIDKDPVISAEKGNSHILKNPDRIHVYQYHIDGEIINDSIGKRCDYIVEAETSAKATAYLIELKGSDIRGAGEQIENTISRIPALNDYIIKCRIVANKARTHEIESTEIKRFKRKYKDTLIRTKKFEETL